MLIDMQRSGKPQTAFFSGEKRTYASEDPVFFMSACQVESRGCVRVCVCVRERERERERLSIF